MDANKIRTVIKERVGNNPEEEKLESLLIADEWHVVDSTESDAPVQFTLEPYFEGMSVEFRITMKLILLSYFKVINGKIDSKVFTLRNHLGSISHIRRALAGIGLNSIKDINSNNRDEFFNALIYKPDGGLYVRNTVRNPILKYLMEATRLDRGYPDTPCFNITWDMFLEWAKPIVKKEMEWSDWWNGGSLGGFPVEFALVILDESLNTFTDDKRIMLARAHIHGVGNALAKMDSKIDVINIAQAMRNIAKSSKEKKVGFGLDEKGFYRIKKLGGAKILKGKVTKYYEGDRMAIQAGISFPFAKSIVEEYLRIGGDFAEFNFISHSEVTEIVQESMYACAAIIQLLTGIRDSEFKLLKRSAFHSGFPSGIQFTSRIKKKNHSIETDRFISSCARKAIAIVQNLHFETPDMQTEDKLLRAYVPWRQSPISGDVWGEAKDNSRYFGLTKWMYNKIKNRIIDFDPSLYPNATSHRFRHSWVEIALRRFDGNVPEAIRQHLRHAYGSYNTMSYMRGKVKQDLAQLEREYIREIIGRAAAGKEDFFGPVGVYIVQKIKGVEVLSEEELEEIVDEFEHIEGHEYGYCLIRKSQKTQAHCYDALTNAPNYKSAKFSNCGGCAGALRMHMHRDAILRIGMKESEVLKSREANGLMSLAKQSRKTLRLCENLINEFDKRIPITEI